MQSQNLNGLNDVEGFWGNELEDTTFRCIGSVNDIRGWISKCEIHAS